MLMKRHILPLALGAGLLAACTNGIPIQAGTSEEARGAVANGRATLSLRAQVLPGAFGPQAIVHPYTPADVHRLTITLHKLDGDAEIPVKDAQDQPLAVELSASQLEQPISFSKLWPETTYRVRAAAFDAGNQLISKGGEFSQLTIRLENDDRPTMGTLKVALIDTIFDGQASGSFTILPGNVVNTDQASISF